MPLLRVQRMLRLVRSAGDAGTPLNFDVVTTRGGDSGESGLFDGSRRRKDDALFELLGTVDELNAALGAVRAAVRNAIDTLKTGMTPVGTAVEEIPAHLKTIQAHLLTIGGMAASPAGSRRDNGASSGSQSAADLPGTVLSELESWERLLLDLTPLEPKFVLPGESSLSAQIHVARTVCRRAERRMVSVIRDRGQTHLIPAQRYINRLSDVLFILAEHTLNIGLA